MVRVVRVLRLRRLECSHSKDCSTRAFFEVVRVVVRGSTKLVRVRHKKYPTIMHNHEWGVCMGGDSLENNIYKQHKTALKLWLFFTGLFSAKN